MAFKVKSICAMGSSEASSRIPTAHSHVAGICQDMPSGILQDGGRMCLLC